MSEGTEQPRPGSSPRRRFPVATLVWLAVIIGWLGGGYLIARVMGDQHSAAVERLRTQPEEKTLPVVIIPRRAEIPRPAPPASPAPSERSTWVAADGEVITNPRWRAQPVPVFPEAAAQAGVPQASVKMRCLVGPNEQLNDCMVLEETPPHYGFAGAALESLRGARVEPRLVDGTAQASTIIFTVRFRLE